MTPKRKKFQDTMLAVIKEVGGKVNYDNYIELFNTLNDKEFNELMVELDNERTTMSVFEDEFNDSFTVERLLKIAEKYKIKVYSRVSITDKEKGITDISPIPKFTLLSNIRKQIQTSASGLSVAVDDQHRNLLTGAVTGKSAPGKFTGPELQLAVGAGSRDMAKELLKFRGGDLGANQAMNAYLIKNGKVSDEEIEPYATGVEVKNTLSALYNGMHIKNNF